MKYHNLCDLVNKIGLSTSPIGQGVSGKVFDFKIENDDLEYVLKEISSNNQIQKFKSCKKKKFSYKGKDGNTYDFKKCYKCNKESPLSEYFISLLASNTGSDNFLKANSFGICEENKMYILMEKADDVLGDVSFSENDSISIIIQIMHAIYLMHKLKINHNDLHTDNIFVKKSKNRDEIITLKVGDDYFSFPVGKYVAKIGDWGLANSFGNVSIFNQYTGNPNISIPIPDYFCPSYDIFMFISYFQLGFEETPFLLEILNWILGGKQLFITDADSDFYRRSSADEYFNMDIRKCNQEFRHVTALNFFNLDIMSKYKVSKDVSDSEDEYDDILFN